MSSEAMILKLDAGGRVMVTLARQIELVRAYDRLECKEGLLVSSGSAAHPKKVQAFSSRSKTGAVVAMTKRDEQLSLRNYVAVMSAAAFDKVLGLVLARWSA